MKKLILSAALAAPLAASTAAQQKSLQLSNVLGHPDSAWLEIPHSPELEPETVTLEAWITPQGTGQSPTSTIGTMVVGKVAQGVNPTGGSAVASYWLGWRPFDRRVTAGYSRVLAGGGGAGDNTFISSVRQVDLGERAHVAFTFDGHWVRVYVNGLQSSAFLDSIPYQPITGYGQDALLVGAANLCCGVDMRFDGIVDEVRIWNHARTAQQIRRHMYCRLTGTETGLVGYWNFDGANFDDRSGTGNDGAIIGSAWDLVDPVKRMQDCFVKPRLLGAPIMIPGFVGPLFL